MCIEDLDQSIEEKWLRPVTPDDKTARRLSAKAKSERNGLSRLLPEIE